MSINSALLAGVSGLTANSSALAAISDNIANVNTVGYKRTTANFSSMVTSQSKGNTYAAGGVQAQTHQYISKAGLMVNTTSNLDMGIAGSGFFVTTDKAEGVLPTDTRSFTRAGSFVIDKNGYLKNDAGLYLQGWKADPTTGDVITDPSNLSLMSSINVAGVGGVAEKTTKVSINATLSTNTNRDKDGAYIRTTDPVAQDMANYAKNPTIAGAVKPDFIIQVPISDSQGGQRVINIALAKSADPAKPNTWEADVYGNPNEIGDDPVAGNGWITSGEIVFDEAGKMDTTKTKLFDMDAAGNMSLTLKGSSDSGAPKWATGLGVSGQTISFDLHSSPGGITQGNTESITRQLGTNGTPFGNLTDIQIDDQGYVSASYDNGVVRRLAQVAIATFTNPNALQAVSGNAYRVSEGSGTYSLKAPKTGGAGSVQSGQLESSTVDLSTEFTGLITTQRAYSAASKIITTADQMLEELINIKR